MNRYGPVLLILTLLLGCTTPLEPEEEPEEAVVIERADFYGSWQWLISFNEDRTRSWTPETVGYSISYLFKEGVTYDTTFYYRNGTFMKSEPYQLLERDGQWILEYDRPYRYWQLPNEYRVVFSHADTLKQTQLEGQVARILASQVGADYYTCPLTA